MKTPREVNDSVQRRMNEGALVQQLKDHEGYKIVMAELAAIRDGKDLSLSASWEDFLSKKGFLDGLSALEQAVDTILARARTAERTLQK